MPASRPPCLKGPTLSNTFTLDALRNETIKKFAPVIIGLSDGSEVELKSLLRLGEKRRKAVLSILEDVQALNGGTANEDSDDLDPDEAALLIESISKILEIIVTNSAQLLKELDHPDLLIKVSIMTEVLNRWIGGAQLGEADNSPA